MHLLIPFASSISEAAVFALRKLKLKHLQKLLARMVPLPQLGTDELSLTMPYERALATAYGWTGPDGCLPWAAHAATQDAIDVGGRAWGLLTPVHWQLAPDHVNLADPQALHLSAHESQTLFEMLRPLFESEGFSVVWGAPGRWYVAHASLDGLPTASMDRVIGRPIELWMPAHPQARLLRRLQNEVQMLLYQQPLNDERVAEGRLTVNSFWLSGCGRAQAVAKGSEIRFDDRLRAPSLTGDWGAWSKAWLALDEEVLSEVLVQLQAGTQVEITLCGERFAQRFAFQAQGAWATISRRLDPPAVVAVLEGL